jgi:DNA repair protein RecN (Recombination protein N)
VELAFDPDAALRERLREDGFELDSGEEASIVREMTEAGRSSVRVNGRPATAAYVREIGDAVAEIVGQHEAQRLLSPAYHVELLDRFAGEAALRLRESVAAAYARAEAAKAALAALTQAGDRARERYDEACFTVREIEEARLVPGEAEQLAERRSYLDNVERIGAALHAAREALAGDERSAIAALGSASVTLASVEKFNADLSEMARRAAALQAEAGELSSDVARALDAGEFEPGELEAINARLDAIDRLKRKYAGGVVELIDRMERARREMEEYANRDEAMARQQAEVGAAQRELHAAAAALSAVRAKAARALSKRVLAEFAEIALGAGSFEVAFEALEPIAAHGAERVEFLFAANAGEPARPLARVASGGELSRVLLALVVVLAGAREARGALVFDEIDAGIGGATATAVGERLGALARSTQVLCVTHLAQIASWADDHVALRKHETGRTTRIDAVALGERAEVREEIARMLSGSSAAVALEHADALLREVRTKKKPRLRSA